MKAFQVFVLSILLASPAFSKDKFPRTHWIQRDHLRNCHKVIEFDAALKIASAIEYWCQVNRLDPDWILALYTVETHFDSRSTDGKGSYGIPQLQINTAQTVIDNSGNRFTVTPESLQRFDGLAIRISCRHFRSLLTEFGGDYIKATRAYNVGSGKVNRGYHKKGYTCLPGITYFNNVLKQYVKIKGGEYGR